MKSMKIIFFLLMLISLTPSIAYYDDFEEISPQPEVAIDPSIQAKFAMSMIMMGIHAQQYALGGYYGNTLMQDQASRNTRTLIPANTEIFISSLGEAWADRLNSLVIDWWQSICLFADSKTAEEEEDCAEQMRVVLHSFYYHLKEVAQSKSKDEDLPDEEILDGLSRFLQYVIIKARQGELIEMDPVLFINGVDKFAHFGAKLAASSH